MSTSSNRLNLGVLISGTGRTLENLVKEIKAGRVPAEIAVAIANRDDVKGLDRAREHNLSVEIVLHKDFSDIATFSEKIFKVLDQYQVELVLLCGFLRLLKIPPEYENRVINIHPALLPKYGGKGFFGHHVHEAVIAAGEQESGCSVHFVDNQYDHGPVILQRKVPVLSDDTPATLADKIFQEECIAYPEAIRMYASGKLPE